METNKFDINCVFNQTCQSFGSTYLSTPISRYSVLKDTDINVINYGPNEQLGFDNLNNRNQFIESDVQVKCKDRTLRAHSTPATLLWLEENYEIAEGVCIPRSVLYMHYVDFCDKNFIQPVNAASFGKIIRQQFPQLTTRRLGTRGQSRYHYYGIAVRETSSYYQLAYSKKSATNKTLVDTFKNDSSHLMKTQPSGSNQANSLRIRIKYVLPDFPSPTDLHLQENLDHTKMTTFLIMYRTHCQRILDTVIQANFDEIQTFVLYFWQGLPSHLSSIISSNAISNLIGICDYILYKCIINVLLPSALQTFPDSLIKKIRKFSQKFERWLKIALYNLPQNIRSLKLELSKKFEALLKRQTSLSNLAQASRMVVNNSDIISQMLHDWKMIDIDAICQETVCNAEDDEFNQVIYHTIKNSCQNFEKLLEEEANLESYFDLLGSIVQHCIVNPSKKYKTSMKSYASQLLLFWSSFESKVIRNMTLYNAPSFGSFHLLKLMFEEYLLYLIDYCNIDEHIEELMVNISKNKPPRLMDNYISEDSCNITSSINCGSKQKSVFSLNSFNPTTSVKNQSQQVYYKEDNEFQLSTLFEDVSNHTYCYADWYQPQGVENQLSFTTFSETNDENNTNKQHTFSCSLTCEYQSTAEHLQCVVINHSDSGLAKNETESKFNSNNIRTESNFSNFDSTIINSFENGNDSSIGSKNEEYINYLNYI